MNYFSESDQLVATKAQELIADIPLMPGITGIRVEPYTDNTGDPSLKLTFWFEKNIELENSFMDQFLKFSGEIQTKILHSDLHRFPYNRLESAA